MRSTCTSTSMLFGIPEDWQFQDVGNRAVQPHYYFFEFQQDYFTSGFQASIDLQMSAYILMDHFNWYGRYFPICTACYRRYARKCYNDTRVVWKQHIVRLAGYPIPLYIFSNIKVNSGRNLIYWKICGLFRWVRCQVWCFGVARSTAVFLVISLDPQSECLALTSPAARNPFPSLLKNSWNVWEVSSNFGGQ